MNNVFFKKRQEEDFRSYCHRIAECKETYDLTWDDVAEIIKIDNTVLADEN